MYLNINNGKGSKSYLLTESYNKPYMKVSGSILPLITNTLSPIGGGVNVKLNNQAYRAAEYTSYSESITYYTTSIDPGDMSETTALTCSSTSGTSYLTRSSTSGTSYLYNSVWKFGYTRDVSTWTTTQIAGQGYFTITTERAIEITSFTNVFSATRSTTYGCQYVGKAGAQTNCMLIGFTGWCQNGTKDSFIRTYYQSSSYVARNASTFSRTSSTSRTYTSNNYVWVNLFLKANSWNQIDTQFNATSTSFTSNAAYFANTGSSYWYTGNNTYFNGYDLIITGTSYLTRSSTYATEYLTRSSTSGYSGKSSSSSSSYTWG